MMERVAGEQRAFPLTARAAVPVPRLAVLAERGYLRPLMATLFGASRIWIWIGAAAIIEALFGLVSPWAAARAIDTALPNSAPSLLAILSLVLVLAVVHTAWAGWLHRGAVLIAHRQLEVQGVKSVLDSYLSASYPTMARRDFGSTSETVNAASTVAVGLVELVVGSLTRSVYGGVTLVMLAVYNLRLAVLGVVGSIVLSAASVPLSLREAHHARVVMDARCQVQDLLSTLLGSAAALRASGATSRFVARWTGLVKAQTCRVIDQEKVRCSRAATILGIQQVVGFTALAWLSRQVLEGTTSLGTMITCNLLLGSLTHTSLGLADLATKLATMRFQIARVNGLFAEAVAKPEPLIERCVAAGGEEPSVALKDVWFRYDASTPWVLEDCTQRFPAGQVSVLRAASGSGKSTILRLLAGLVAPEHGRVFVLGYEPRSTPGLVAYLPQQLRLFEGSICGNLKTLSGASLERVLEVARLTGLKEMLDQLPMGVDTVLSEAGNNLSAGQRQLVALTAVFASACPVVLLDEATSHLDAKAQSRIQWQSLGKGRTIISVHHQEQCKPNGKGSSDGKEGHHVGNPSLIDLDRSRVRGTGNVASTPTDSVSKA